MNVRKLLEELRRPLTIGKRLGSASKGLIAALDLADAMGLEYVNPEQLKQCQQVLAETPDAAELIRKEKEIT